MKLILAAMLALTVTTSGAADARYRGRFYWGPDVQVFEPCTQLKAYWVEGDEKTLRPLITRSEQLQEKKGKHYRPVYVELIGSLDTKSERHGAAEDYDGLLRVRKVVRASTAIPKKCSE